MGRRKAELASQKQEGKLSWYKYFLNHYFSPITFQVK